MEITAMGIDLAKSVFQLHGVDRHGKAVLRKKLPRVQLGAFMANLSPCLIGMEACAGSNFWAREFKKAGHEVRLIPAQFVKPFVKSNKNDAADAEAICEALQRPNMRFAAPKSIEQQDIQSLHRIRKRLIGARTALINELRGLVGEYGVVLPRGPSMIRKHIGVAVQKAVEEGQMTAMSEKSILDLFEELAALDGRVKNYDDKIQSIHRAHPVCQRLSKMPGIGPITATAMIASVGNAQAFKNGRQFAAWLGLVPRQHSSGGKERLLGISKRGDTYLRMLLIHGARVVLRYRKENPQSKQEIWINNLVERRGMNRAAVALANKNARRIWVLMARDEEYREIA